jgi:hypothetical protein
MLNLNWKFLIPVAFVNLVTVAMADRVMMEFNLPELIYVLVMFLLNIAVLGIALFISGKNRQDIPREQFPPRPVAVPPPSESK